MSLGLNFLPKIQAGFAMSTATQAAEPATATAMPTIAAYSTFRSRSVPLDYQMFNSAFHGDNHKPTPDTWLAPTFSSVWNNITDLRQFNVDQHVPCDGDPVFVNCDANDPNPDPRRNFSINEKSPAAYAQLNYDFDIGSVNVGGVLGMRWVKTKDHIRERCSAISLIRSQRSSSRSQSPTAIPTGCPTRI